MLMVLLMAPERKGCAAAIIFRWPRQAMERPPPAASQRAIEDRQMLGLEAGRAFDGASCDRCTKRSAKSPPGEYPRRMQRLRNGVVDDLDQAAADQLLVLHQRQIRLDAGGVAIHHEADGAGGREHGYLRILVAVLVRRGPARRPKTRARAASSGGWTFSA